MRPFGVGSALPEGSPAVTALVADVTSVPKASISGEFRGVPRFVERPVRRRLLTVGVPPEVLGAEDLIDADH